MEKPLTLENIQKATEDCIMYLKAGKVDRKEIARFRLNLEEVLLTYRDVFGETAEFSVKFGKALGSRRIRIYVPGERYDPYQMTEEESPLLLTKIDQTQRRPQWSYRSKQNCLTITAKKKSLPFWASVVLSIAVGLLFGLLVGLAPESAQSVVRDDILTPALDTFMGFLTAAAGPMIFLSVVWSIYGMGDISVFNSYGKKILFNTFLVGGIILCLCVAMFCPVLHLDFGGTTTDSGGLKSLYTMLLGSVPDNLFTPFTTGNTLQILFLGVLVGLCMIFLGEKTQNVGILIQELGELVRVLMDFVLKLLPFYIFGSIVKMMLGKQGDLSGAKMFLLIVLMSYVVNILLHTVVDCVSLKISPVQFWKKTGKPVMIALVTSSSAVTFPEKLSACIEGFGVEETFAKFGISFLQVLYKSGTALTFVFATICVADSVQIPISVYWIIMLVIVAIFLSIAAPPVAGGSAACYAILFAQFGLPEAELALIISLNVFLEFPFTAVTVFGQQSMVLFTAKRLRKLDEEILRKP